MWLAILAVAVSASAVPARAQSNPIDDLLKLAMDAFNDFKYTRADSLARSVMTMNVNAAQRARAQMVIAAAAYPEDASAQRRPAALATLKQLVRTNFNLKLPQELTWAGLDSLVEEAKRTTYAFQLTAEQQQTAVGPAGTAKVHFRSNKPSFFRLVIAAKNGGSIAIVDSVSGSAEGDFSFKTMRDEKPIFSTGDYTITVTAFEPGGRGDTVTAQYGLKADAPALSFSTIPTKMDSTRLLKERTGRFGAKSILPAVIVGAAAFALSSGVQSEGKFATNKTSDSKGTAVGGLMFVSTILAGYMDRGRPIPANIAANKATGDAFQKSIVDAQAENRRRITDYRTILVFELEAR